MTDKRRIVDAREGYDGNISHVLFEGNERFTSIDKAISMVEKGIIEIDNAHTVHRQDGSKYLRTHPDGRLSHNLDSMAEED